MVRTPREPVHINEDFLNPAKVHHWSAAFCARAIADLYARYPRLRVVFCTNRKTAEAWTRNYFAAVSATIEAVSVEDESANQNDDDVDATSAFQADGPRPPPATWAAMIQLLAMMGFAIRPAGVTRPHVAARLGSLAFRAVMETWRTPAMTLILTAAVVEAALGLRTSRRERSRDDSLVR